MVKCMLALHEVHAVGPIFSGCSVLQDRSMRTLRNFGGVVDPLDLGPLHRTRPILRQIPQSGASVPSTNNDDCTAIASNLTFAKEL